MKILYRIAENESITVIERFLPESINGFFHRENNFNLICVERRLGKAQRKITLAHELGHYFTSSENVIYQDREFFNTCSLDEHDEDYLNEFELADIFGVTPEFVRFRVNIRRNRL